MKANIWASDVLQTEKSYLRVIEEIRRVLKSKGILLVTFLNKNFPSFPYLGAYIRKVQGCKVRFPWQVDDYNPTMLSRQDLTGLFESKGYRLIEILPIISPAAISFDLLYYLRRLMMLQFETLLPAAQILYRIDALLGRLFESNLFLIVAQKEDSQI